MLDVHYVGKVVSILDENRFRINFLRMKSVFLKDTFYFPTVEDVEEVEKDSILGVLTVNRGTTQRQSDLIKIFPPLANFNMR